VVKPLRILVRCFAKQRKIKLARFRSVPYRIKLNPGISFFPKGVLLELLPSNAIAFIGLSPTNLASQFDRRSRPYESS
jgi:hypothetical protein